MFAGGFPEEIATNSKTSCVNCGLLHFLKGMLYFDMRNLTPVLNLGFLYSFSGLLLDIFYILRYQINQANSSRTQYCMEMSQLLCIHYLRNNGKV